MDEAVPITPAVMTAGLSKDYGTTHAVAGLDLHVEPGQVFGYLGPNGAGKTTTIRLLLGLHHPSAGHARVLGLDPVADGVDLHRRIGYLPGELALYPRMTGWRHIDWFAKARSLEDLSAARALAERFHAVLDRPARELSKGNKQKIGLILAFMARPELLILDEPTAGLDPLMQDEFEHLARETVAEGRTVFLSSHELDEVQRLADRVAIIKAGQLVTEQTVEALRAAAPQRIQARFPHPIDPALLARLEGVTVTACDADRLVLEATGPIGPVLQAIAEHDPIDFSCRHADLDELFLDYYRDREQTKARHVH